MNILVYLVTNLLVFLQKFRPTDSRDPNGERKMLNNGPFTAKPNAFFKLLEPFRDMF